MFRLREEEERKNKLAALAAVKAAKAALTVTIEDDKSKKISTILSKPITPSIDITAQTSKEK